MNRLINMIFTAAALIALLCPAVYAAEIREDYTSGTITVNENVESDTVYGVTVFNQGREWSDLTTEGISNEIIKFNDQIISSKDGVCSFSFRLGDECKSGIYKAYIVCGNEKIEIDIPYINKDDYTEFINALNLAAKNGDTDAFYNKINEKADWLGTTVKYLESQINFRNAMNLFCGYVKDNPLSISNEIKPENAYNGFIVIQAAKEGKLSEFSAFAEGLSLPHDLTGDADKVKANKYMSAYAVNIINYNKPESLPELSDSIREAMILSIVKYAGGAENARDIINRNKDFIGVASISFAQAQRVAGQSYNTKNALKAALSQTTQGTGGGGGGGSTSQPKSSVPYVEKPITDNNTTGGNREINVQFTDIDGVAWANEAITALYDKKIINGRTEERFYPDDSITREEFVKMAVTACGFELIKTDSPFADVAEDAWFKDYANTAFVNGLINGIGENLFGSGENITRQDIAVILYNASKMPSGEAQITFTDENLIADYSKEAVRALASNKIINGRNDGSFDPQGYATRAEAAKMLYGVLEFLR